MVGTLLGNKCSQLVSYETIKWYRLWILTRSVDTVNTYHVNTLYDKEYTRSNTYAQYAYSYSLIVKQCVLQLDVPIIQFS